MSTRNSPIRIAVLPTSLILLSIVPNDLPTAYAQMMVYEPWHWVYYSNGCYLEASVELSQAFRVVLLGYFDSLFVLLGLLLQVLPYLN